MITIAKAPVRLGLAGGGSDIEKYFLKHNGATLNATINSFVRCYVENSDNLNFVSIDNNCDISKSDQRYIKLHKEAYRYFCEKYLDARPTIKLSTYTDIEAGSGLGTSSTMVVTILAALAHHFRVQLCPRALVKDAHYVERVACELSGGWQDYISAAYGGFNFTKYDKNGEHWVKPLYLSSRFVHNLEESLVLFFSGLSRHSDAIIKDQINSVESTDKVGGLHGVHQSAYEMLNAFEDEDIEQVVSIVNSSWEAKKSSSNSISNRQLDEVEANLRSLGVDAFKISGAGGGGYCMVFVSPAIRSHFLNEIDKHNKIRHFSFVNEGVRAWTAK